METWVIVLAIIFIIVIGVLSTLVYFITQQNNALNSANILYPFSGVVDDNGTISLLNSSKHPQIDCSVESGKNGGSINIVGAFVDIIDPYGACTPKAASVLNMTCGIPEARIACKLHADCGGGSKCAGGFCTPGVARLLSTNAIDTENSQCLTGGGEYCPIQPGTVCLENKDCNDENGDIMMCVPEDITCSGVACRKTCEVHPSRSCYGVNTAYNTCALYPLCSNSTLTPDVSNNMCKGGAPANCMARDASAYLAGTCDGKTTCSGPWDINTPENGFGPSPCSSQDLSLLPLSLAPGGGTSFLQGYYVHGIYSCVPK